MNKGDYVRLKNDDGYRPGESGTVTHVEEYNGKRYLGIHIDFPYTVGHTVWRFWDRVVVITPARVET
jgi:hypothetical protein